MAWEARVFNLAHCEMKLCDATPCQRVPNGEEVGALLPKVHCGWPGLEVVTKPLPVVLWQVDFDVDLL